MRKYEGPHTPLATRYKRNMLRLGMFGLARGSASLRRATRLGDGEHEFTTCGLMQPGGLRAPAPLQSLPGRGARSSFSSRITPKIVGAGAYDEAGFARQRQHAGVAGKRHHWANCVFRGRRGDLIKVIWHGSALSFSCTSGANVANPFRMSVWPAASHTLESGDRVRVEVCADASLVARVVCALRRP